MAKPDAFLFPSRARGNDISSRRFPPPWSIEEMDACFVVRDHNGQQFAYVYFDDGPAPREAALNLGF